MRESIAETVRKTDKKSPRRAKGEGHLFRPTGCSVWYVQYYRDGKQIRESTGKRVKQEALVELRRKMGRSEQGLLSDTELRKTRYADLRAGLIANYQEKGNRTLYQTADGEETIGGLKSLDSFFGFSDKNPGPTVLDITTDTGRRFAKKQLDAGFSTATINRSLACLRRMLRIAHEDGKIQTVPIIRLQKEPPARKGFLTPERFEELLGVLPTHLRPLILFLYWCGVRLGEAQAIEWSQVDLQGRLVRLEQDQTKNAVARIVPLPAVLVETLTKADPKTGRVFDDSNLRLEWARACSAVGLGKMEDRESEEGNAWKKYSGLIVHDLRRSAVRNLVNAGIPERVAMGISGHKTRSVFDRYHIVSTEDVSNAMQRLETASLNGQKKPVISEKLVTKPGRKARKLLRARSSNG